MVQVGEGESPDEVGHTEKPGTADESSTVEVTSPEKPDSPEPADIAEGEESPAEAATNASLSAVSGAGQVTAC